MSLARLSLPAQSFHKYLRKMKKSSKNFTSFNKVYESYYSRYTAGCFCQGDVIKFTNKSDIFNSEPFKNLQPDLQDAFREMVESQVAGDSIIVVTEVCLNPLYASNYEPSTMTIAYSQGGGRVFNPITIPGTLAKFIALVKDDVNLPNRVPQSAIVNYQEKYNKVRKPVDLKKLEKEKNRGYTGLF